MQDVPSHLERVELHPDQLTRWRTVAGGLGHDGMPLLTELADVERDPTRHMLRRAARAARYAAEATGSREALEVAREIETLSGLLP